MVSGDSGGKENLFSDGKNSKKGAVKAPFLYGIILIVLLSFYGLFLRRETLFAIYKYRMERNSYRVGRPGMTEERSL